MKAVLNRVKDITLTTDKMVRVMHVQFHFSGWMSLRPRLMHRSLLLFFFLQPFPVGRHEGCHQGAARRRAQGQR